MHARRLFLLILLLVAMSPRGIVEAAPGHPPSLEAHAQEFRELRKIKGHFSGGDWRDDVDRWNGRKHVVMVELGDVLGNGRYTVDQVDALMGPPDELLGPDSAYWQHDTKLPPDTTQLRVYYWRGHHDFLYFICRNNKVTGARWFMAGE